jgi:hypothetical protein
MSTVQTFHDVLRCIICLLWWPIKPACLSSKERYLHFVDSIIDSPVSDFPTWSRASLPSPAVCGGIVQRQWDGSIPDIITIMPPKPQYHSWDLIAQGPNPGQVIPRYYPPFKFWLFYWAGNLQCFTMHCNEIVFFKAIVCLVAYWSSRRELMPANERCTHYFYTKCISVIMSTI